MYEYIAVVVFVYLRMFYIILMNNVKRIITKITTTKKKTHKLLEILCVKII